MFQAGEDLPLLPTSVVGSHGRPAWLVTALAAIGRGEYGPRDVAELADDAVAIALRDQELAGVDVVTDGEMRRQDFILNFYGRMQGIEAVPPERKVGAVGYDQIPTFVARERIRAPQGLGLAEEFRRARAMTARPLKATCPGPLTLAFRIRPGDAYRDDQELAYAMAEIVNAELRALVAAGARFLQLDEPRFSSFPGGGREWAVLFNRTVDGVEAKLALHVCFGNYHGRPGARRSYRPMFPDILAVCADQLVLEFRGRELAELDLWGQFPNDKELGLGVVDVKSHYVETAEEVAEAIRAALRYVRPEKLWINPDCGFNHTPRWVAVAKLRAMVEGARIVRRELTGEC